MENIKKKEVLVINPTKGQLADKKLRVAAYCRVSTDSEDQVNSFIAQVKYYSDFIKQDSNKVLVDIYADEGITGTCVNKRDDFLRMMKDSKAGKIDRIYVKSVSRFARNSLECIENIRLLKSYGTTVLFENDGIDTERMNSEMILYIKSAFAQSESLSNSKRVTTAFRMKMQNGEISIFSVPYGFTVKDNVLIPVPELKPVIERVYREYLSGKGMGKITEEFNNENYAGKRWTLSAVKYILNNEKYIGDSLMQKTYTPQVFPLKNRPNRGQADKYYITNTHEAMIDRELYDAVQKKLKKQRLERENHSESVDSVFNRKIKCGDCGCAYKKKMSSGELYWVCSMNGIAGQHCKTHNIKEIDLKKAFVRLYNKIKQNENEIIDYPLNQLIALKTKISSQCEAINDIDDEIAVLCDRNSMLSRFKARNIIDDVSFMEQTSEVQKRLTELRNRRIKLLNFDEDEACIEKLRVLKAELDENDSYMLFFDEEIFESFVEKIVILENGYALFELKCGLKLKELI